MASQLWTTNALAVEFGHTHRTMSARLVDLSPDEEKIDAAGRPIRRWRLARVFAHLQRGNGQSLDDIEELICRDFYPAVVSSRYFRGLTINYLRHELGVPTVDALRAYKAACLGMAYALAELFQGVRDSLDGRAEREEIPLDDLAGFEFMFPACFEELKSLGPEAYAAKYWPDKGGLTP